MNTLNPVALGPERCVEELPPIASVCRGCAEFLAFERTPWVGMCLLHAVQVLAQDRACSHYYQIEEFEPVGHDDEF